MQQQQQHQPSIALKVVRKIAEGFKTVCELVFKAVVGILERVSFWFFVGIFISYCVYFFARELRLILLYGEHYFFLGIEAIFNGVSYFIGLLESGIEKIVQGIEEVATFGIERHSIHLPKIDLLQYVPFVPERVAILGECNSINTMGDEVLAVLRLFGNSHVCPVVRYMQPIPLIGVPLKYILYPFIFDPSEYINPGCPAPSYIFECMLANIYLFVALGIILAFIFKFGAPVIPLVWYVVSSLLEAVEFMLVEVYDSVFKRVSSFHKTYGFDLVPVM